MNKIRFLTFVLVIGTLVLTACGSATPTSTPAASGAKVEAMPVAFVGIVDSIAGDQWVISGTTVTVDESIVRDGPFKVGDHIKVEGFVNPDGSFTVSRVEIPTPQDIATQTPSLDNSNDANINDGNINDDNSNSLNSNDDNGNTANSNDGNTNDDNGGNANSNDDNSNAANSNDDNGGGSNSNDDSGGGGNSNDDNGGGGSNSNDDSGGGGSNSNDDNGGGGGGGGNSNDDNGNGG